MNKELDLEEKVQKIFSYEAKSIGKIRRGTKIKMLFEMSGIYSFLDKAATGTYFVQIRNYFNKLIP